MLLCLNDIKERVFVDIEYEKQLVFPGVRVGVIISGLSVTGFGIRF